MILPKQTNRLDFRAWTSDDLSLATAIFGDATVNTYVGGALATEAIQGRLAGELANQNTHHVAYWPITLREESRDIGCCGLRPRTPSVYELGFYLLPAAWGSGYAVEAAQSVIRHAFTALGASALFAGHHPENTSSKRTLERLHFRFTHCELYAPTGLQHPSYTLTQQDFDDDTVTHR